MVGGAELFDYRWCCHFSSKVVHDIIKGVSGTISPFSGALTGAGAEFEVTPSSLLGHLRWDEVEVPHYHHIQAISHALATEPASRVKDFILPSFVDINIDDDEVAYPD